MPSLELPTEAVRTSYLAGERESERERGASGRWLDAAEGDFAGFVANRARVRERWGVPYTELWFVDGCEYLGTVLVRHRLTPSLRRIGGHIGYHIVPAHRRRGHATEMLAQALAFARSLGVQDALVTCAERNLASRRVIEANGGVLESIEAGECLYWFRATSGDGGSDRSR